MGVPADPPAGAVVQEAQPGPGGIPRSGRRRRPSGKPPALPRPLRATGVGWLVAAVVLVVLSLLVFAGELRAAAVAVTVVDDAVVGWLAGWDAPGLTGAMKVLAALGSWVAITVLLWGLLLALLILRRLRQLLVVVIAWTLQGLIIQYLLAPLLASAAAVRGGVPDRLAGMGAAVRTDGGAGGHAGGDPVRASYRRAAGVRRGKWMAARWWRWSPWPTCTSGWRRPPMCWWAW